MRTTQGCYVLFWTNPWSNTPQNCSCTANIKGSRTWFVGGAENVMTIHKRRYWMFITHGRAKIGWPERTWLNHVYLHTVCSLADMPQGPHWLGRIVNLSQGAPGYYVSIDTQNHTHVYIYVFHAAGISKKPTEVPAVAYWSLTELDVPTV